VRAHGETKTERPPRTLALPAAAVQALRALQESQIEERLAAGTAGRTPGWSSPPAAAPPWTQATSGRCSSGSAPRPGPGTAGHARAADLLRQLDEPPRSQHRGDRPRGRVRHHPHPRDRLPPQTRPVITTGAEIMDQLFTGI